MPRKAGNAGRIPEEVRRVAGTESQVEYRLTDILLDRVRPTVSRRSLTVDVTYDADREHIPAWTRVTTDACNQPPKFGASI